MGKHLVKLTLPVISLAIFSACAPKPQSTAKAVAFPMAGPMKEDVDLKLTGNQIVPTLTWEGESDASQIFFLTEDLLELQNAMGEKSRAAWAKSMLASLPQNRKKLIDSDYTELVVDRAQSQAKLALNEVVPQLKAVPQKISEIAKTLPVAVNGREQNLEAIVRGIFKYLKNFKAALAKAPMMPEVQAGVNKELNKNIALEDEALSASEKLMKAKTLLAAVTAVDQTVKKLDLPLDKEDREQLERGRRLGQSISEITDARQALATLIDVWLYLDADDREKQIKAVSPDLYDYLATKTVEDLNCLKTTACLDLPTWAAKTLVIQPKINDFGIEKIRDQLNLKGAASVREVVSEIARREARKLPETLKAKINDGLQAKVAPVLRLQNNFAGEFRARMGRWAGKKFETQGPSVLSPSYNRALLMASENGQFKLKWSDRKSGGVEDQAAFAALAPKLWSVQDLDRDSSRALVLQQIGDLAKDYRSNASRVNEAPKLKARAYAESLRAYAQLAGGFDEKSEAFIEKLLGPVTAADFFQEFKSEDLAQKIFPTDAFYALSFHGMASLLGALQGAKSQVFTVSTDYKVARVTENQDDDSSSIEVMAGVADRMEGGRMANTSRSEDVARLLIGVCDVSRAMEGAAKVTKGLLVEPDASGQSPQEQMTQGREKIKLLIIGLANYLSHQFRSEQGLIKHELLASTQESTAAPVYLMDQALAVRALVRASEELKNDIYHWEAADIVLSMNRHLFNRATGFYSSPAGEKLSPLMLTQTLRALQAVAPQLSTASREQIDRLQKPWLAQVAKWQLN